MRLQGVFRTASATALALLLASGGALWAGCGEKGSGAYVETVLAGWSRLEEDVEKLAGTLETVEDREDMAAFSKTVAAAAEAASSFAADVGRLEVPEGLRESHIELEGFLSGYGSYLRALADWLAAADAGETLGHTPDLDATIRNAREALDGYRDSQDYNAAGLDGGIWDLPGALNNAILAVYGGAPYQHALKVLEAWYHHFNRGEGKAMYELLDETSPIKEAFRRESFLVQVGEAHDAGLRADYFVDGVEHNQDQQGDWVTFFLVVDYSEHLDMEGATVPARRERVYFDLLNREDGFLIYRVYSESAIW